MIFTLIEDAKEARKYIDDFIKSFGRDISYIETSKGRKIEFETMDNSDAIWVANQFQSMVSEADMNRKRK